MAKKKKEDKKLAKIGLAVLMKDYGYDRIVYNFSGGGDSGDIDDPIFLKPGEEDEDAPTYEDLQDRRVVVDRDIIELLYVKVDDILCNSIDNWWDYDGGGGRLTIQLPSTDYKIDYYINIVTQHDRQSEGTLIEND